jgi:hypothetical protein
MTDAPARIVKYAFVALALIAALLVLFINGNLAALADLICPGSALWTHIGLLTVELLALFWFWKGIFRGKKHLLLLDEDGPEAQKHFAAELMRRMRDNPHVQKAAISLGSEPGSGSKPGGDEEYLSRCLALLDEKADAEIRLNARRIFLATALAQNGRIDALIVFVSLCRLVWRVSKIYNQNPHPREIASLYWAVISSTFLALSIEETDIATEITVGFGEAFHAMAPAGLTAGIPFAGKALQTFTASTIDGAANCYLALRAGIITRNAYAYTAKLEQRPGRAAVFREAGAILLSMSQELVDKLASALVDNLAGAARYAGGKTVQAGKDVVDSIGTGAGRLATGTVQAGKGIAGSVGRAGTSIGNGAGRLASGAVNLAQGAGSGILRGGGKAGKALKGSVSMVASTGKSALKRPFRRKKKKDPGQEE